MFPELCVESVEKAHQRLANGHACVRLSCAAHPAAVPVGQTEGYKTQELKFLRFISFIRIESFKRLLTAKNKFIHVYQFSPVYYRLSRNSYKKPQM